MRIGFDAKRAFHNFRGLGNYSRTLLLGLAQYHSEIEQFLFTPDFSDSQALEFEKKVINGTIVRPVGVWKSFSSLWRSLFLARQLKKYQLNIYHGLSHEIPPFEYAKGCAKIVTIHDLIFLRYPDFFPLLDRLVYKAKFAHSCQSADKVIAICQQTKVDLVEFLNVPGEKIEVVYQACDPKFYRQYSSSERELVLKKYGISGEYILYVGALEERKNAKGLVRAYLRLKNRPKLVLIGKGPKYAQEVLQIAGEAGASQQFHILDRVLPQDLPFFYQSALFLVYPSFFEGFGLPIVEALFSKTPVITSRGSCFPESGGPDSIYIDPNNIEEMALAMQRLIDDPELGREMAKLGHDFVQKFHLKNTTENLVSVYQSLLS